MTHTHHHVKENVNLNDDNFQRSMIGRARLGADRMAKVRAQEIAAADSGLVTVFPVVEAAAASLASSAGESVERQKLYKVKSWRARNIP